MSIRVVKLMIKATVVKESTSLATNIDDKIINNGIVAAQKKYILPLLGSNLYNNILNSVYDNTITGDYKSLYDDYIIDTLAAYVKYELTLDLNYQFTNAGTNQTTSESYRPASMQEMFSLKKQLLDSAEVFAEILRKHLETNYRSKYPEYKDVGTDYDAVYPQNSGYDCPIYLD
jgi:hypothetical protein